MFEGGRAWQLGSSLRFVQSGITHAEIVSGARKGVEFYTIGSGLLNALRPGSRVERRFPAVPAGESKTTSFFRQSSFRGRMVLERIVRMRVQTVLYLTIWRSSLSATASIAHTIRVAALDEISFPAT